MHTLAEPAALRHKSVGWPHDFRVAFGTRPPIHKAYLDHTSPPSSRGRFIYIYCHYMNIFRLLNGRQQRNMLFAVDVVTIKAKSKKNKAFCFNYLWN